MTQDTDTPIRRRPDGSIDTAYYMARGRRQRSETFHQASRRAGRTLPRVAIPAILLSLLPVWPGRT